ncbi:TPA: hypothetical protein SIC75_001220 [Pasteurella multocida]|uniref:Uncharacterized protein n=3 Tax=Pasteurella multocida TaxID=747 RepID=A0A849CML8_PASMD|nr:hypothetical protein [Pasteurella multocida]AFF23320.1 hypothetical protein PMCN06_0058 [Pasteurella multocida subsp. multocida str. HN06]AFI45223.1 hypothetical protein NT08PM_0061 [Pasteurella multocida subsp. multocida str. 3480]EPE63692.1 hypothetical protein I141_12359 [Pasteurella multocida P1933]ESQ72254.1 hypothetical protein P1062_0201570 [Pasteurella multocida subsp. multocida P1062]AFF24623.1 hypothetical protein PMCN06_1393 [Pasteurella multocida subsp. multocida str. HN06]
MIGSFFLKVTNIDLICFFIVLILIGEYMKYCSAIINYVLIAVVISLNFLILGEQQLFIFFGITLTAAQLGYIAKICSIILFVRCCLYFFPVIKQWIEKNKLLG